MTRPPTDPVELDWMAAQMTQPSTYPAEPDWEVPVGFVHAGAVLAFVAGALRALAARLTRRASTSLLPPAPDPLATYRDGPPVECPRHPFAW